MLADDGSSVIHVILHICCQSSAKKHQVLIRFSCMTSDYNKLLLFSFYLNKKVFYCMHFLLLE